MLPAIILMRPSALPWLLAAGVVVLFYLRAIRPPRVVVARAYLLQQVLGAPRSSSSAWLRRRVFSGAIHVAVILLLVIAASDPCVRRPRTVVFVVDNSQSMAAIEDGESRLAKARTVVADQLSTLGPREYAALITTAGRPIVVLPAEQNLERVEAALERIRTVDLPSRVAEAVAMAKEQTARGTRLEICVVSDGCFEVASGGELGGDVTTFPVGSPAGNAAVTRLAVRRYPGEASRFQVIVHVANHHDSALKAHLRIVLDEKPIHESEIDVEADLTEPMVIDLESATGGPLEAILDAHDPMADDNRLNVTLPGVEPKEEFPEVRLVEQHACDTRSPESWCGAAPKPEAYHVVPLWPWLVAFALALVTVEWWLYHRRWTC